LDSADGEVRDLERNLDWRTIGLKVDVGDGRKTEMGAHEIFLATLELIDGPEKTIFLGSIFDTSDGSFEFGSVGVFRDRDHDADLVGGGSRFKLRSGFDGIFDSASVVGVDVGFDPEEWFDTSVDSVGHEIEIFIWRNERDCFVAVELGQTDTLVKGDIFKLDGFSFPDILSSSASLRGENDTIVEPQSQLGHSTQMRFHLDGSEDLRSEQISVVIYQKIHFFNHIEEDLVLLVEYSLWSPTGLVGQSWWRSHHLQFV